MSVELLRLTRASEDRLEDPARLQPSALKEFMQKHDAEVLASTHMQIQGHETARFKLAETFPPNRLQSSPLAVLFELEVAARPQLASGGISLEVEADLQAQEKGTAGHSSHREITSSLLLDPQHVFMLGDLAASSTSEHASVLAVVLRPRIITAPPPSQLDRQPYWIGSEARLRTRSIAELQ